MAFATRLTELLGQELIDRIIGEATRIMDERLQGFRR
jgi:hypothetical protein